MVNRTLPLLQEEMEVTSTKLTDNDTKSVELATKIKEHAEMCKENIDILTAELVSFTDKIKTDNRTLLQMHHVDIQQQYDELNQTVQQCKFALQSVNFAQMFDISNDVDDIKTKYTSVNTLPLEVAEFSEEIFIHDHLTAAMGQIITSGTAQDEAASLLYASSLKNEIRQQDGFSTQNQQDGAQPSDEQNILATPIVITQFKFPYRVSAICPLSDGCAWISQQKSNKLQLTDNQGQTTLEISHDTDIRDFSLSQNSFHPWFCCDHNKSIHEVILQKVSKFKMVIRFSTKDEPRSICITKDDFVVVGTKSNATMYTHDGIGLYTTTIVDSNVRTPLKITQCPLTGNLAVVSKTELASSGSQNNCHIIVYDEVLQVLFRLTRKWCKDNSTLAPPISDTFSIVYDSKGNLLVADGNTKLIELFDGAGRYIKRIRTNVQQQMYIGIQPDNVLWGHFVDTQGWNMKLLKYNLE